MATADALLRAKGLRVARYTSPHLVDFRERMVVNGEPIDEDSIVRFIAEQTPAVERLGASFFEATTALAFQYFASMEVDVALIETGLGGRLDSTNVVQPRAAGITAIGFDHMEYLGPTLEAIASEKAGIFKRGVPAVVGEPDPVIRAQLRAAAERAGASSIRVVAEEMAARDLVLTGAGTRFTLDALGESRVVETPLIGRHQAANFAFTLALLDAAGGEFRVSLEEAARHVGRVRLPGRFQRVGKWIFDVAHNPDGAATVAGSMAAVSSAHPVVAVLCVLGDKDWRAMMDALSQVVDAFILTNAPTAPHVREWVLDDVLRYAEGRGYFATRADNFDEALRRADAEGQTVLVTGSFHTVGDAMARLQVSPLTG